MMAALLEGLALKNVADPTEPLRPPPETAKETLSSRDRHTIGTPPHRPALERLTDEVSVTNAVPRAYLVEAREHGESLIGYAAEAGIEIDADTRNAVLQARLAGDGRWNEQTASNLLSAVTKLAAWLKPVTAQSLKACITDARPTVRSYRRVAIFLAILIIPFSLATFVTSAVSEAIRKDIDTANGLAVKLRAQLGPPPDTATQATPPPPSDIKQVDVITELQEYASAIRSIDGRARQLNVFVLFAERDPNADIRTKPRELHEKFQLPHGLPDLADAAGKRTAVFQDVRYFAQSVLDDVSFFYGAITACILPVLYALLGACAYLLRSFEEQTRARTFAPSVANTARFVIAAIGGAVVGLFNKFTVTEGASIPPLAVAFLVGYAVDVFFSFLEGLLQTFTKTRNDLSSRQ